MAKKVLPMIARRTLVDSSVSLGVRPRSRIRIVW